MTGDVKVNLTKMIERKQAVVDQTSGGVKFLNGQKQHHRFEGVGSLKVQLALKSLKKMVLVK